MGSEQLHEERSRLRPATVDRHRAIRSIMEELEAIDWYDQRVDVTDDPELAEILAHNRDEEKEHAAMTIEWLRRHDPVFDRQLRTYLFTTGNILAIEDEVDDEASPTDDGDATSPGSDGSLSIGDLKGATS